MCVCVCGGTCTYNVCEVIVGGGGGGGLSVCACVCACVCVCMCLFTCVCAWDKGTTKKKSEKEGKKSPLWIRTCSLLLVGQLC